MEKSRINKFYQHCHIQSTSWPGIFCLGLPVTRKLLIYGSKSSRESPWRLWNTWWMKRGWETWFSLRKRRVKCRSYYYLQIPSQDCREDARLFLEVHSGRGTENKFEHGKFLLDRDIFFFFLFFLPWKWLILEQLAQRGCRISILEDI